MCCRAVDTPLTHAYTHTHPHTCTHTLGGNLLDPSHTHTHTHTPNVMLASVLMDGYGRPKKFRKDATECCPKPKRTQTDALDNVDNLLPILPFDHSISGGVIGPIHDTLCRRQLFRLQWVGGGGIFGWEKFRYPHIFGAL